MAGALMTRIVTYGEILLRLSPPGRELLLQSPELRVFVGGAEANVASALASLAHDVAMVSVVPDNDLGRAALSALRGRGVDTRAIRLGGDRMPLYFATAGSGLRAGDVIYDRAGSGFALATAESWDWDAILAGADRLHLSGVTPALGPEAARSATRAAHAAYERGVKVSFDGNWRGQLWAQWNSKPARILRDIVEVVDVLFGNNRDIALLLGRTFDGDGESCRRDVAQAAFAEFPGLQIIASTIRHLVDASHHRLAARIDTRGEVAETEAVALEGIVDRIGGGDAFAAGVLHALHQNRDPRAMAQTGLALAALKHSIPGDAALVRQADIDAFSLGNVDLRR
jgi:2-dehydro-3-deoxygluconokinase